MDAELVDEKEEQATKIIIWDMEPREVIRIEFCFWGRIWKKNIGSHKD